jgi:hypothetical protein
LTTHVLPIEAPKRVSIVMALHEEQQIGIYIKLNLSFYCNFLTLNTK